MGINQIGDKTMPAIQQYQKLEQTGAEAAKKTAAVDTPREQVELSSQAKEIQQIKSVISGLPEVRQELVANIKEQIAQGTYQADPGKIAAGMARESLLDIFV